MNHIKSIILENFQSHKSTAIQPAGPGQLTVIIGPSDTGKTALIRGLKWLAFNSPNGTDFIRVGTQATAVQATMTDGTKLTRYRSRGGVNRYLLEDNTGHKQTFESFGTGVPLEIREALEIAPTDVGDMEFTLNLSEQLDGPFLGNSVPATARAKVLGKLSGVEEVDHAGKTLGTDLYRKRREVEGIRSQIDYLGKKIEEYGYLDELGPLVDIVDKNLATLKGMVEKKKALTELKIRLTGTKAAITQEEEKLANLSGLDEAERQIGQLAGKETQLQRLATAWKEWTEICFDIDEAENILEETKKVPAAEETLCSVATQSSRLLSLQKLLADTNTLSRGLKQTEGILEATAGVPKAEEMISLLSAKDDQTRQLRTKSQTLTNITSMLSLAKGLLEKTAGIAAAGDTLNKIAEAKGKLVSLQVKQKEMQACRGELLQADSGIMQCTLAERSFTDNLRKLYKEAAVCPLCGNQLNPEKLLEEVV